MTRRGTRGAGGGSTSPGGKSLLWCACPDSSPGPSVRPFTAGLSRELSPPSSSDALSSPTEASPDSRNATPVPTQVHRFLAKSARFPHFWSFLELIARSASMHLQDPLVPESGGSAIQGSTSGCWADVRRLRLPHRCRVHPQGHQRLLGLRHLPFLPSPRPQCAGARQIHHLNLGADRLTRHSDHEPPLSSSSPIWMPVSSLSLRPALTCRPAPSAPATASGTIARSSKSPSATASAPCSPPVFLDLTNVH